MKGRTEARCIIAALRLEARGERLTFRSIADEAGYSAPQTVHPAVHALLAKGLLLMEPGTAGSLRTNVAVVIPKREGRLCPCRSCWT